MSTVASIAVLAVACGSGSGSSALPSGSPTPRPSGSPSPSLSAPPGPVRAVRIAAFDQPLDVVARPGDTSLYVVGKKGQVWALRDGAVDPMPVLDLTKRVSHGSEQGLLGLAFSPDGAYAYVNYTDRAGETNVVEYAWRDGRADPSTERRVLFVDQPFPNHNGGNLMFGPDGDLYIGMGDGGSDYRSGDPQGDPHRNGQNLRVLLGKMLRIEPRPSGGKPYAIPPANPFLSMPGARPEIWAYGLRNPWRFSFDRDTGDLWIGDVGAGRNEEIDLHRAGTPAGQNFGWNAVEGTFVWRGPPPNAIDPVDEYGHDSGGCAITGGFVYRGSAIPDLRGWFVYGDFCLGDLQAMRLLGDRPQEVSLAANVPSLSSFGEDQQGELYAVSLAGGVYKLEP